MKTKQGKKKEEYKYNYGGYEVRIYTEQISLNVYRTSAKMNHLVESVNSIKELIGKAEHLVMQAIESKIDNL